MADFEKCSPHIKRWEGEWADDPDDLGGATMYGIIFRFFQKYSYLIGILEPTKDDLRNLTWNEAQLIYRETFWKWIRGNEIKSQKIAETLLDHCINADELKYALGRDKSSAICMMQRILKIKDDGICGPVTVAAINEAGENELFAAYQEARRGYYNHIADMRPQNRKFLNGWLNRVNALG